MDFNLFCGPNSYKNVAKRDELPASGQINLSPANTLGECSFAACPSARIQRGKVKICVSASKGTLSAFVMRATLSSNSAGFGEVVWKLAQENAYTFHAT